MGFFQGRDSAGRLIVMIVLMSLYGSRITVLATNYNVGDGSWEIKNYDDWLAGKTFRVGDTVEFVYTSVHNVVEVNEAEYGSCSAGSNTVKTDGDSKYTLTTSGTKYFICSVATHCETGMKIAIPVEAAAVTPPTTSPTPSTTNSTSPSTPTPTPPTDTNTTTGTPPGSASSPLLRSSLLIFPTMLFSLGLSILLSKS